MTGDQTLWLVYGLLALVLVGSALAVRRLKRGHAIRMALTWLIILAAATIIALRFDLHL